MNTFPPLYPQASVRMDPEVMTTVDFPALEQAVLEYWERDQTFRASVEHRPAGKDGANEFVMYDGPPFANGLPHYGHLLTGYAKDLIARFQTQRGRRVERRFGWDTHGLPAELEAMKQLGLTEKRDIEAMGIDAFNAAVRESVLKYSRQWREYVTRQARWVDFDHDYKTLNTPYMESVLWVFQRLHDLGLTYQSFRVLPYCWKDETPLSNHELRMDDGVYKPRQDLTVTVTFPVRPSDHPLSAALAGGEFLAWTTTPWTLPTNFSLAVGGDIVYAVVPGTGQQADRTYILAEARLPEYCKTFGYEDAVSAQAAITARYDGRALEGLEYVPLWGYYTDTDTWGTQNCWRVVVEDYVSTNDGTGIVHQAPAYGEEDQRSSERHGIPVIVSVDEGARFLPLFAEPIQGDGRTEDVGSSPLGNIAGLQVFEANKTIIRALRQTARVLSETSYEHSYPHCWRCKAPLIYRAVTSWYIRATALRERMLELNQTINWVPEKVKDGQFGAWLDNVRDWSVSRNRFWGTPIPVWLSDDPQYPRVDVYGSLAELERDFGCLPRNHEGEVDLHRPFIDALVRPNPDDPRGVATMRRVEDVLDVWMDSGSMPYGQAHYPFENRRWLETHYPADYVVEYIGQTRGWFYVLHVLATALLDRPAFRNVLSHGIVLGTDGQKMSKSLRNYPDVTEVFARDGSDAMRWYLMSSPILRGGNLIVTERAIREGVRQALLPLWNVYGFFVLYANAARRGHGYRALRRSTGYRDVLDRYLLAQTGRLIHEVGEDLESYEISAACERLRSYLDMLSNWYVRRSRQRFFDEEKDAFDALYTALEAVCRIAAPLLPLVAEEIWRGLTGERSVHLTDWPLPEEFARDADLTEAMDLVRHICSTGSSLRKAAHLRVRLPLAQLTVIISDTSRLADFRELIADELNVKHVELLKADQETLDRYGIRRKIVVNFRQAGQRLGPEVQHVARTLKASNASFIENHQGILVAGIQLFSDEYEERLTLDQTEASVAPLGGDLGGFVVLDTGVTAELEAEGMARDVIRLIQQARKDAGLHVSERIRTTVEVGNFSLEALREHAELIQRETLSHSLDLVAGSAHFGVRVSSCTPDTDACSGGDQ